MDNLYTVMKVINIMSVLKLLTRYFINMTIYKNILVPSVEIGFLLHCSNKLKKKNILCKKKEKKKKKKRGTFFLK